VKQHKYNVRKREKSSALFQHIIKNVHSINWTSASVLAKVGSYFDRCILESVFISSAKNFNGNNGMFNLDPIFINNIKKQFQLIKNKNKIHPYPFVLA